MDHTERLSQNLEVLGVDKLSSLSLQELMERVDSKFPPGSNLSRRRLLHPFISWLHERLTIIDNSDEEIVRNEIQTWVNCLRNTQISDTVLAGDFKAWESEHIKIEPLSARRLGIAWIELEEILTQGRETEQPIQDQGDQFKPEETSVEPSQAADVHDPNRAHGSTSLQEDVNMEEDHRDDVHPDRNRQLRQQGGVSINDDHWGGMHPDRFKQSLRSASVEKEQPAEQGLSFLTGANRMVYLEQMKDAPPSAIIKDQAMINAERSKNQRAENAEKCEARREARKPHEEQTVSEPPRQEQSKSLKQRRKAGNGQCGRCGNGGHAIHKCPTTLIPEFDVRPANGTYSCSYCGSRDHYATCCRKNPLPDSINQRRIRAGIWEGSPSRSLTASPTPRGSGRHARDYDRESDGKLPADSHLDNDRDYGDGHDTYYKRNYDQDHDHHARDHNRNRGRPVRGYERRSHGKFVTNPYQGSLEYGDDYDESYDQPFERDHSHHSRNRHEGDWDRAAADKDSDRRDKRRLQQCSRSSEEPRADRDSNRRRSSSHMTRRHIKERPYTDRYRLSKRASHTNSRRSRSPDNRDRRTSSRRLRSPIQDRLHSMSPSEERGLMPKARNPDRVYYDQKVVETERTSQVFEPREEPLIHPSRTILFHQREISGVLSYSDNPDATEDDVDFPECAHSQPADYGFTREEFIGALDEFIREVADETLPSGNMAWESSMAPVEGPGPAENSNPKGILQSIEDVRPVTPLITTITWPGIMTIRQKRPGNVISESLSELSINETPSAESESPPPLELGVSVKPKPNDSESLYDSKILEMMKRLNKENIWLHQAQRSRAQDLLTAKTKADGLNETPVLAEIKLPETPGHETGWEVGAKPNLNGIIETAVPNEQHDITMSEDVTPNNFEVAEPASAEDSFMAEVPTSGEPRANSPASDECLVMTTDIGQQQRVEGQTAADDQVMTDDMPENTGALLTMAENRQPSDELFGSEEESYISLATEDGSITEPGDRLVNEVDMLDQDAAHD